MTLFLQYNVNKRMYTGWYTVSSYGGQVFSLLVNLCLCYNPDYPPVTDQLPAMLTVRFG